MEEFEKNYVKRGSHVIPLNLEGVETLLDKIDTLTRENEQLQEQLKILQKEHDYYHAEIHDILGNF